MLAQAFDGQRGFLALRGGGGGQVQHRQRAIRDAAGIDRQFGTQVEHGAERAALEFPASRYAPEPDVIEYPIGIWILAGPQARIEPGGGQIGGQEPAGGG
ncbi:hypothetical protein D9M71_757760 [compost metagenome]